MVYLSQMKVQYFGRRQWTRFVYNCLCSGFHNDKSKWQSHSRQEYEVLTFTPYTYVCISKEVHKEVHKYSDISTKKFPKPSSHFLVKVGRFYLAISQDISRYSSACERHVMCNSLDLILMISVFKNIHFIPRNPDIGPQRLRVPCFS